VPRNDGSATVVLKFRIPELRSGYYWVTMCRSRCSARERAVSASQINVVADDSEERLLDFSMRISEEVTSSRRKLRRILRRHDSRVDRLERRISKLEAGGVEEQRLTSVSAPELVMLGAVASGVLRYVLWLNGRSQRPFRIAPRRSKRGHVLRKRRG
jgi:hypothetical protein